MNDTIVLIIFFTMIATVMIVGSVCDCIIRCQEAKYQKNKREGD